MGKGPRVIKPKDIEAEDTTPALPYQPKPAEQEVLDRQREKRRARGPMVHMGRDPERSVIGIVDHTDPGVGGDLYMASIGTTDWEFGKIITAHIAGLSITDKDIDANSPNAMASFTAHQALVQGIGPKDEIEALLAVQMAAVHSASMMFANRLRTETRVAVAEGYERSLNRLTRTFTTQIEAMKRHRTRGVQKVIVQHVQVNEGGQAVVAGEVRGGGAISGKSDQPHERDSMRISESETVLGTLEAIGVPMPGPGGDGLDCVPVSWGQRRTIAGDPE